MDKSHWGEHCMTLEGLEVPAIKEAEAEAEAEGAVDIDEPMIFTLAHSSNKFLPFVSEPRRGGDIFIYSGEEISR